MNLISKFKNYYGHKSEQSSFNKKNTNLNNDYNKYVIRKSMDLSDSIFVSHINNSLNPYLNTNVRQMSDEQLKTYYSGFIATCFDLRAEAVSQAQICLYKYDSQKKLVPLEWHPFLDIIRRPNLNYPDLSFAGILDYTSHSNDIFGNGYWYMPGNTENDLPAELWVIPFDEMKICETDEFGVAKTYLRTISDPITHKQSKIKYDAKYILPFPTYSPYSQHYGMGIIQKSLTHLNINNEASNYQNSLLRKGGILKSVIENSNSTNTLDDEEFEDLFNQKHAGSNGSPVPMLPPGYTLKPLQISPVDLDLIALKKFSKEEVLNMCRVPASTLGSGDSTNKSTAAVNMIAFNHMVIRPILQRYSGYLSMYLYKRYGEDILVEFTLPLPSDPEVTIKQFQTLGLIARDANNNPYSRQILIEYMNILKLNKIPSILNNSSNKE